MCMVTPSGPQALLLWASVSYRSRRTLGKDLLEVMTHPFKTCTDMPSSHASTDEQPLHVLA